MLQFTTIARASDGLILGADTATSQGGSDDLERVKATAKNLLKKLSGQGPNLPEALTVEAASSNFHILTEGGVLFLTMCDPSSPSLASFAYLEKVAEEFLRQHGQQVDQAKRPYYFIKFDMTLQKIKRTFSASSSFGGNANPRNNAPVRKSFREVMGYGPLPKGQQAGGAGKSSDMTIALVAGGIGLIVVVGVIATVVMLS
jgi:hypothetical protein